MRPAPAGSGLTSGYYRLSPEDPRYYLDFTGTEGNPIEGASFLVVFNAHHDPIDFTVAAPLGDHWVTGLDTAAGDASGHATGDTVSVEARSMRVMRRHQHRRTPVRQRWPDGSSAQITLMKLAPAWG